MIGVLLDTNALIWVLAGDPRLGGRARAQVAEAPRVHFLAVSVLEITLKEMLGRLRVPGESSVPARTRA
ncbi:hypothetical protein GCG21_11650 [Pseudactinotalea sp. HY160]|uniref:hypothetical protein n=1 Tax=Pseudactinotalea sp. HY160 TaxID=2654490 RepID=UPI00128E8F67|nr:hypothetical protein [Pseudactinotalea sp. HY160]MPV50646.1 hypothetical protein [Pseudactinotalea sp. HY160]